MKVLKNICFAITIFILFFYSWLFQLIPILIFNMDTKKISTSMNVVLSAFASLCLAIILIIIYKKELITEWKMFRKNFKKYFDIGLNHWLYGLIIMIISNTLLNVLFKVGQSNNEEAVQSMITALPWMAFITSGILAPVTEEIVFRKSIKKIFNNKLLYILVSGFLFGLAHVFSSASSLTDWLFIVPYGSLGVAFAASYYDTDSIFTPIFFHMMHNMILVLLSIF